MKKTLLLKGHAGLGNRITVLIGAIIYARLTNRKLVVHWNDPVYSDDGTNVFDRLFCCPGVSCDVKNLTDVSVKPKIWRGKLDGSVRQMIRASGLNWSDDIRELTIDTSVIDHSEDVLVMTGFHFPHASIMQNSGYFPEEWHGLEKYSLLKKILAEHVSFHPSITGYADSFIRSNFSHNMIGVHLRLTDKFGEKTKNPRAFSLNDYFREIDRLLDASERGTGIFLATDSAGSFKHFIGRYKNMLFIDKWYPKDRESPMHNSKDCPDKLEMAKQALTDMYLLSKCDYLIAPPVSSFSRVAWLLNSKKDARRIRINPLAISPMPLGNT